MSERPNEHDEPTIVHDNRETPPAVPPEPVDYEGPPKGEQQNWIQGTSRIILVLAIIFAIIIIVYFAAR